MNLSFQHILQQKIRGTNQADIDLCIIELCSGNYQKSLTISEKIIFSNNNNGWALKAISQTGIFDYENNLHLLNSAIQSIRNFKVNSSLSKMDTFEIQAVFINELLNRSVVLANNKLKEIEQLKADASYEKTKGTIANLAAIGSYLIGSNAKTKTGKILGYGGAVAGLIASHNFKKNAQLITDSAKGEFAETVSNIALTVEMATKLKDRVHLLHQNIQPIFIQSVTDYMQTVSEIYNRVITNYTKYCIKIGRSNPFTKYFYVNAINIAGSTEGKQFIFFSQVLEIQNSVPEFKKINSQIMALNSYHLDDVKKTVRKMHFIAGGISVAGVILVLVSNRSPEFATFAPYLLYVGIGLYIYFRFFPLGMVKNLKQNVKVLSDYLRNFKIIFHKVSNLKP